MKDTESLDPVVHRSSESAGGVDEPQPTVASLDRTTVIGTPGPEVDVVLVEARRTFDRQMAAADEALGVRPTRWLDQTILHDPANPDVMGNCWQTCIATLLGLPLDQVPHFVQLYESMREVEAATRSWARERGFDMLEVERHHAAATSALCILHGRSPRNVSHVVIGCGLEVVHDPHPSRAGLASIAGAFLFVPLDPALAAPEAP